MPAPTPEPDDMAGKGYIDGAMWRDNADWRALPLGAQHLYLLLLSQPDLSMAGTISMSVTRWARFTSGRTADDVRTDLALLAAGDRPPVVVDEDTEEVLVRTKIRNDGVWKSPNLMKAALTAAKGIESRDLRAALLEELLRVRILPDLTMACREVLEDMVGHLSAALGRETPIQPALIPPTDEAPVAKRPPADVLPGVPVLAVVGPRFDDFWRDAVTVSPRTGVRWPKSERIAAQRAWDRAVRRAKPEDIMAGALRYRDDPNREEEYTKNPATWLNKGCWTDEPLRARNSGRGRVDPFAAMQQRPGQTAIGS